MSARVCARKLIYIFENYCVHELISIKVEKRYHFQKVTNDYNDFDKLYVFDHLFPGC